MAYVLLLEELLPKNSFLFSIQQETFFYFYFFNLIFPANIDLQGLPLTAWGWEEAFPQAKSFWSISFVGILAASSQEDCNHCQRHNTRPKWPFKLTKCDIPCVDRSGDMGGDSQICFSADRQQFLLLCCGGCSCEEHDFGVVVGKVIRCLNAWLPTWRNEMSWSLLNHRVQFRGWSLLNHRASWSLGRALRVQHGRSAAHIPTFTHTNQARLGQGYGSVPRAAVGWLGQFPGHHCPPQPPWQIMLYWISLLAAASGPRSIYWLCQSG